MGAREATGTTGAQRPRMSPSSRTSRMLQAHEPDEEGTSFMTDTAHAGDAPFWSPRSVLAVLRRHWVLTSVAVVVVAVAAVGSYVWSKYRVVTSAKYSVVDYKVPSAPHLVAATGETIYRIDPTHSSVGYTVEEKFFGQKAHTARGTTNGIAGDLALNAAHPSTSRVGKIVVNVEQLHSDNNLRDAKMRADNLQSHDFPFAYLTDADLSGLPTSVVEGTSYRFELPSRLTVHGTTAPVTWHVDGRLSNGAFDATATATVKMSTFHIGPISIAGLVSTGNDVSLTMKLRALDPSKFDVPNGIAAPASAKRSGDSPSFRDVIMPALEANCVSCHKPGEVGGSHWRLATAADAANTSDGIGLVVGSKYMPPWPASTVGVPIAHSRALDQKTIDAIVKWAHAGGPLDVPRSTRLTERRGPAGPPPRHDIDLRMAQAYQGSDATLNDYRCFILDPHVTAPLYVTGFDVTPDQRQDIHHVQIFHADASQAAALEKRSGKDGKPGWSCYGTVEMPRSTQPSPAGHRLRGFTGQAGLFAGWVPGQDPVRFPAKTGVLFQPGDVLVFQVHYHYDESEDIKPDRSTVSLQVDRNTAGYKPIDIINPLAPVEIPCNPDQNAPLCDRNASIADGVRRFGPSGGYIEQGLLGLCHKTAGELAATLHNGVASSTCESTVPESGTIVSVFGHEHTLGRTFRLTLDPDKPDAKVLLDIPTWNFDWQMNYVLAQPLHVTAGQKVRMDCTWDRALDPNRPPKYIVFSDGTEDEMCFATYSIVPDKP
jgi:polyisoprenoid-binding protein YceI